jgi:hypothetical protein
VIERGNEVLEHLRATHENNAGGGNSTDEAARDELGATDQE